MFSSGGKYQVRARLFRLHLPPIYSEPVSVAVRNVPARDTIPVIEGVPKFAGLLIAERTLFDTPPARRAEIAELQRGLVNCGLKAALERSLHFCEILATKSPESRRSAERALAALKQKATPVVREIISCRQLVLYHLLGDEQAMGRAAEGIDPDWTASIFAAFRKPPAHRRPGGCGCERRSGDAICQVDFALARAGKTEEALMENQALTKKIHFAVRNGALPDLRLRSLGKKSLLKQTLLQQTLILAIAGKTVESADASEVAGRTEVNDPTEDDLPFRQSP